MQRSGIGVSKSRLHYKIGLLKCQIYNYPLLGDFYEAFNLNNRNFEAIVALKKHLDIRAVLSEDLIGKNADSLIKSFIVDNLYDFTRKISQFYQSSNQQRILNKFTKYLNKIHAHYRLFEDPILDLEKGPTQKNYSWDADTFGLFTETYEQFNGSFAQDVMGLSDDTLRDAFNGDPDAYWNID
jgi:hypothetical protein